MLDQSSYTDRKPVTREQISRVRLPVLLWVSSSSQPIGVRGKKRRNFSTCRSAFKINLVVSWFMPELLVSPSLSSEMAERSDSSRYSSRAFSCFRTFSCIRILARLGRIPPLNGLNILGIVLDATDVACTSFCAKCFRSRSPSARFWGRCRIMSPHSSSNRCRAFKVCIRCSSSVLSASSLGTTAVASGKDWGMGLRSDCPELPWSLFLSSRPSESLPLSSLPSPIPRGFLRLCFCLSFPLWTTG